MKKILILGSSPDMALFVKSAKSKGLYTVVVDSNPKGAAKKIADVSYDMDVRDIDALEKLFKENPVDGITTGCSEVLLDSYVELAHRLGLRSYLTREQLIKVRVKSSMKEMLQCAGVEIMKHSRVQRNFTEMDLTGLSWPLVVKPEDSYGSRGVFVVTNIGEMRKQFDEAASHSNHSHIVVEEFCGDDEHSMLFWIDEGKPYLLYLSDLIPFGKTQKYVGYCHYQLYISREFDEISPVARDVMEKIVDELNIKNGTFSMQVYFKNGKLRVNEIAGRTFGFGGPLTTRVLAGFGPEDLLIDYAVGNPISIDWQNLSLKRDKDYYALYMYAKPGHITSIEGLPYINSRPEVYGHDIYFDVGDEIKNSGNRFATVASFFIESECHEQAVQLFSDIYENFKFLDANGENLIVPTV